MKEAARWFAATAVGLVLFALPFVPYAFGGHVHATGPHTDHGARHGGHLMMLRDYHLELIERVDSVELYLSDSIRKPLRPASCRVFFDDLPPTPCQWKSYRSAVKKPPGAQSGLYELSIEEGPTLTFKFP